MLAGALPFRRLTAREGLADLGLSTRLPMKAGQMAGASRSHMCFLAHIWLSARECSLV